FGGIRSNCRRLFGMGTGKEKNGSQSQEEEGSERKAVSAAGKTGDVLNSFFEGAFVIEDAHHAGERRAVLELIENFEEGVAVFTAGRFAGLGEDESVGGGFAVLADAAEDKP